MTSDIFVSYLTTLNKKFIREKRRILPFLDNCASHPHDLSLSNIRLAFLPANTTSVLQPMDQGIIRSFKCRYRRLLHEHVIRQLECDPDMTRSQVKIDLLLAMNWIRTAWQGVTEATIRNCFSKAGILSEGEQVTGTDTDRETEEDVGQEMEDWVTVDNNLRVHAEQQQQSHEDSETEAEDEEESDGEDLIKPSFVQVVEALNVIRRFDQFHEVHTNTSQLCDQLERQAFAADVAARKQSKVTDYFSSVPRPSA